MADQSLGYAKRLSCRNAWYLQFRRQPSGLPDIGTVQKRAAMDSACFTLWSSIRRGQYFRQLPLVILHCLKIGPASLTVTANNLALLWPVAIGMIWFPVGESARCQELQRTLPRTSGSDGISGRPGLDGMESSQWWPSQRCQ